MSKRHLRIGGSIAGVLLVLVAFCWLLLRPDTAPTKGSERASVSSQRATFQEDIRRHGPERAYAFFREVNQQESFDRAHSASHIFGESLYEVEGVKGVAFCDASFNYGCFHGFFTATVGALGLEVVPELDTACGASSVPGAASMCQHGIGHGILEFLGHDHLVDALDACAGTDQPDPLAGCTSGVFMEYNVPLVAQDDGNYSVSARPLVDATNPYAPCDTLTSEPFRRSCFQELPQWWKQVYPEDYAMFGSFCEALPNELESDACVNGIAKMIPSSAEYDVKVTESYCALLPAAQYERCILRAAWAFKTNTGDIAGARKLCSYGSFPTLCPQP